jgi:hypothetical protein
MQVGMADTAGFGLDQNLARAWRWNIEVFEHQCLAELFDLGDFHFLGHDKCPVVDFKRLGLGR